MRWAFWRKHGAAVDAAPVPSARRADPSGFIWGLVEALPAVLSWMLPSSAAVMALVGQLLLALVLAALAVGLWLRLWRTRRRRPPARARAHG